MSSRLGPSISFVDNEIDRIVSQIKIKDSSVNIQEIAQYIKDYYSQKYSLSINIPTKYEFIDLFCGAGGLSIGLEQEGFRPVLAVDHDQSSLKTYQFNRPWMPSEQIIQEDIRNLTGENIFPHVPLVVGGPPCQGFSIANKQKKENDARNELYKFYVQAVKQARPKIFLVENVPGILSVYDAICADFKKIGFNVCEPIIISPKDFGFPQTRKRAFLLGINNDFQESVPDLYDCFKTTIFSAMPGTAFSLWDAIGDLPPLSAKTQKNSTFLESKLWGYTFAKASGTETPYTQLVNPQSHSVCPLLNHKAKYNNERDILIYQTLKPGEKSDAESISHINPYKNRADIFLDKFDKLVADCPCKAITAHMYYDCNMYIHPYQARGLTPREAARVQGFPDDYLFLGSPNEWYRQIGNAVSPLVARVLGRALNRVLERIGEE